MNYVKNVDELKEYQNLLEKLNYDIFDIPGFHKVSAILKNNEFEIQASNSDILWLDYDLIKKYAKDYKINSARLSYLTRIYQNAILARNNSELLSKLKVIVEASSVDIFEIVEGTLLNDCNKMMIYLGASKEDAYQASSSIENMFFENEEDKLSPEGKAIFTEYLNYLLEKIGSYIYILLEFINKTELVILPVPKGNIDKVLESEDNLIEGEAIKVASVNIELGQSIYSTYANYQKDLEMIWKISDAAINLAGQKTGVLLDYFTDRKPNATSIYVYTSIKGTPLKLVAILNSVEAKKIFGYDDSFIFSLESSDGFLGDEFMELKNENEIADAIKRILNINK
jgi:hypothetical protein